MEERLLKGVTERKKDANRIGQKTKLLQTQICKIYKI